MAGAGLPRRLTDIFFVQAAEVSRIVKTDFLQFQHPFTAKPKLRIL